MNKLKTAIERVSVKVQESDSPVLTKQIDSTVYCRFSELKCKVFFLSENYILPTYSVYMGGSEQTVLYSYNAESRVNLCLFICFICFSGHVLAGISKWLNFQISALFSK